MTEQIIEILKNLLKVKSIVTIYLTVIFGIITLNGSVTPEQFIGIFSVVIAFYFGVQYAKKEAQNGAEKAETTKGK